MDTEKSSNIEEEKIKEAETEPAAVPADRQAEEERHRKMDGYIEFGLIFILGILIGIAVKTEANKRITIGFEDYQMKLAKQDFNINQLQFEVTKRGMEESEADRQEPVETAGGDADGNQTGN
ncbi:MAG: hypothetical protein Q8L10_02600 [Candidatus Moranbacteria bacterium]|nr:hypothetical protein [Candidatus Moranbacteria bacterium]